MPPASRITDQHLCPIATPAPVPVPHIGGMVIMGAPTVFTGALPQARVTDSCLCAPAVPNAIASGSMTVFITSLPAARVGDMTLHGGALLTGLPTVIIGG